jgi:uncharacterized phage protein (TIGR02220 family)
MAWVRLDDGFPDHPKVVKVGPLGETLQVRALCYAGRHLTDGFIPLEAVQRLTVGLGRTKEKWSSLMVKAGLWEERDGGFVVHDYLEYNPSRDEVLEARRVAEERSRKGGLARAEQAKRERGRFSKSQPETSRQAGGKLVESHQPKTRSPSPSPKEPPIVPQQGDGVAGDGAGSERPSAAEAVCRRSDGSRLEAGGQAEAVRHRRSRPPTTVPGTLDAAVAEVILDLNTQAGTHFSPTGPGAKHIRARLREGRSVEVLKAVTRLKVAAWASDAKMRVYLRPATLFNAEKFEAYLQELAGNGRAPRGPVDPWGQPLRDLRETLPKEENPE